MQIFMLYSTYEDDTEVFKKNLCGVVIPLRGGASVRGGRMFWGSRKALLDTVVLPLVDYTLFWRLLCGPDVFGAFPMQVYSPPSVTNREISELSKLPRKYETSVERRQENRDGTPATSCYASCYSVVGKHLNQRNPVRLHTMRYVRWGDKFVFEPAGPQVNVRLTQRGHASMQISVLDPDYGNIYGSYAIPSYAKPPPRSVWYYRLGSRSDPRPIIQSLPAHHNRPKDPRWVISIGAYEETRSKR